MTGVAEMMMMIIIIIFINCNWVITRWQWLFYMYTNMKKKVTRKFNLLFFLTVHHEFPIY